jgi:hypothetical protein
MKKSEYQEYGAPPPSSYGSQDDFGQNSYGNSGMKTQ